MKPTRAACSSQNLPSLYGDMPDVLILGGEKIIQRSRRLGRGKIGGKGLRMCGTAAC